MFAMGPKDYVRKYEILISLVAECIQTSSDLTEIPNSPDNDDALNMASYRELSSRLIDELDAVIATARQLHTPSNTWPQFGQEITNNLNTKHSWKGFNSDVVNTSFTRARGVTEMLWRTSENCKVMSHSDMLENVSWDIHGRVNEGLDLIQAMSTEVAYSEKNAA